MGIGLNNKKLLLLWFCGVYIFIFVLAYCFFSSVFSIAHPTRVLRKLFQMQSLNQLILLNTRMTRSCRLGIALASWTKLNIDKLAPANAGECESRRPPNVEGTVRSALHRHIADDEVHCLKNMRWKIEPRNYGRCPDLCVNTNVPKWIDGVPTQDRDNDEWRALPRVLCDNKDRHNAANARRKESKRKKERKVVYVNRWSKETSRFNSMCIAYIAFRMILAQARTTRSCRLGSRTFFCVLTKISSLLLWCEACVLFLFFRAKTKCFMTRDGNIAQHFLF